jgi:hypothetical protein
LVDKGRRVLFVSPNGSDSLVAGLDDEGLLWHMLPGAVDIARTYVPLVARIEQHLNPTPPSGPRPPLRLALVTSPESKFLDDVGTYLRSNLMVNGMPLLGPNQTAYRAVALPSTPDLSSAVQVLRDFKPHLIVSAASHAFLTGVAPLFIAAAVRSARSCSRRGR